MAGAETTLDAARTERNVQQAKYYKKRFETIAATKKKWLPFKLMEAIALMGSVTAIVSVVLSFMSTSSSLAELRQSREDTAFYEALQRMGDKDSAIVRAGAANLLALKGESSDYYETVRSQLLYALLLEDDPVVLEAIQDACGHLLVSHAGDLSPRLKIVLQKIHLQALNALAMLTLDSEGNPPGTISDETWTMVESFVPQTGLSREDYEQARQDFEATFASYQKDAAAMVRSMSAEERTAARLRARTEFQIASRRWRLVQMLLEDAQDSITDQ